MQVYDQKPAELCILHKIICFLQQSELIMKPNQKRPTPPDTLSPASQHAPPPNMRCLSAGWTQQTHPLLMFWVKEEVRAGGWGTA